MRELKYVEGHIEKNDDYAELKNFIAQGEITVTITLAEYRELIAVKANKDYLVDQAEKDKWQREQQNKKLTEENDKLKAELYALKTENDELKACGATTENTEEDE